MNARSCRLPRLAAVLEEDVAPLQCKRVIFTDGVSLPPPLFSSAVITAIGKLDGCKSLHLGETVETKSLSARGSYEVQSRC